MFLHTSYLQLSRGGLAPTAIGIVSTALILLFREEVFSSRHAAEWSAPNAFRAATGSTRMRWRRANILAPGFRVSDRHASFFPPSPSRIRGMIGPGKSYPVTAAQLLPNLTGIPRTAPRLQLTKNCRQK